MPGGVAYSPTIWRPCSSRAASPSNTGSARRPSPPGQTSEAANERQEFQSAGSCGRRHLLRRYQRRLSIARKAGNRLQWHELQWHELQWHEFQRHELQWHELQWHELQWHELQWHELQWHELQRHELQWHE